MTQRARAHQMIHHESTIFQRVLFDVFAIKVFEEMCSRESLRKMCDNINTLKI